MDLGSIDRYLRFLPYLGISALLSIIITPWVGKLSQKLGMMQRPPSKLLESDLSRMTPAQIRAYQRRSEKNVPTGGGISYISIFLILSPICLLLSNKVNVPPNELSSYLLFFLGVSLLFALGMYDDKYELSGKVQFAAQLFCVFLLVISPIDLISIRNPLTSNPIHLETANIQFSLLGLGFSISLWGDLLIILWSLVIINAVKWLGGSDALMEGNTLIASFIIFLVSIRFFSLPTAVLSIILAGGLLGFLPYNFFPAKIESGSSGKSVLGFIIAGLSLISGTKLGITALVLAIPLVDFVWVLYRRMKKHKPKSLAQLMSISDRSHLHHRLLKLGWNERQVAYFQYLITGILGIFAFALTGLMKAVVIGLAVLTVFAVIVFTSIAAEKREKEELEEKTSR